MEATVNREPFTIRHKEKHLIPLLGGSNIEEVIITWETKILDDGYMVVEMEEFDIQQKRGMA